MKPIDYPDSLFKIYELTPSKSAWYDRSTALMLSLIDEFHADVRRGAKLLNIKPESLQLLDEMAARCRLATWFSPYYPDKLIGNEAPKLVDTAHQIMNKYHLGERWLSSIELLLVKDYLVLPLTKPSELLFGDNVVVETDFADRGIIKSKKLIGKKVLSIRFNVTEQTSVRALAEQLYAHPGLDELLQQLPAPVKSRMKPDEPSMHWGYQVWALKTFRYPNASWQELVEHLIELNPGQDVPDRLNLMKDYKRFVATIDRFRA